MKRHINDWFVAFPKRGPDVDLITNMQLWMENLQKGLDTNKCSDRTINCKKMELTAESSLVSTPMLNNKVERIEQPCRLKKGRNRTQDLKKSVFQDIHKSFKKVLGCTL